MDSEGNLYIANFSSSDLVKITPEEEVSSFATMPGNNMGHLLLRGDDIFVVGRGNNKIFKVSNRGVVETFAGSGSRGLDNGSLEQATFSLPNDIAFSPDGTKIYVNDVARLDDTSGLILNPVAIRVIEIVE
jgi:sugar lactone lactonase YvrE